MLVAEPSGTGGNTMDRTRQLLIVHLSDVHFGAKHRFNPPSATNGDCPQEDGYPSLADKLFQDLSGTDPQHPVLVCCTGDLVETASIEEYQAAEGLADDLTSRPIFGISRGLDSFFVVPGNHDVLFDSSDIGIRWQQWTEFYNRLYSLRVEREQPWDFVALHDRLEDHGALILTLNSSIFVEKGKPDQERGRIDLRQLACVEEALESIPKERLQSAIRIALVHHHPILIPALAEPGRGYDAIHNSGKLMSILRRFGFHLILHGHKHYPHTFTEDVSCAFHMSEPQPILVVAGGSIGSTGLPTSPKACNSYNRILVKWHPSARQFRVVVETRGLDTFNDDGSEKLPNRWKWRTLKQDERQFFGGKTIPSTPGAELVDFTSNDHSEYEQFRTGEYRRTRGNMPVVSVMPSLVENQAYEARLWIVPHGNQREEPSEVHWIAGPRFPVVRVARESDPNFCARFNYWGPMLVQAQLKFADGTKIATHIYAHLPRVYQS